MRLKQDIKSWNFLMDYIFHNRLAMSNMCLKIDSLDGIDPFTVRWGHDNPRS